MEKYNPIQTELVIPSPFRNESLVYSPGKEPGPGEVLAEAKENTK